MTSLKAKSGAPTATTTAVAKAKITIGLLRVSRQVGLMVLPVAPIALAPFGLGFRIPLLILGQASADVVRLLEFSVLVAAHVSFVSPGIDQLTRHDEPPWKTTNISPSPRR